LKKNIAFEMQQAHVTEACKDNPQMQEAGLGFISS